MRRQTTETRLRTLFQKVCLVLTPTVLWIYTFRGYLFGHVSLGKDARNFFIYANYFIYNIMHGVYPAWDPYIAWGRPNDLQLRTIGELNPLMHIMTLLNVLGVSPYYSFCVYLCTTFFLGILGFYFLSKTIFHDKRLAYLAAILLLFSSFGKVAFSDPAVITMFTAIVWFLYFFFKFLRKPSKASALGITFSTMIIMTTYIPFYFATIFLLLIASATILYYRLISRLFKNVLNFTWKNKIFCLICSFLIVISILPGIEWYLFYGGGNYVASGRQGAGHTALMALDIAQHGNFWGSVDLKQLILGVDARGITPAYIPFFIFLVTMLSVGNIFNRRLWILLSVGVGLFLITLLDLTPVFAFFYRHVFFFKYFRNYHYLIWMGIIPLVCLFAVEQLRQVLDKIDATAGKRTLIFMFIAMAHILGGIFIRWIGSDLWSAYLTILLSLAFWALYCFGFLHRKSILFLALLFFIAVSHPLEVYSKIPLYETEQNELKKVQYPPALPFSFTRPTTGATEAETGTIPFLKDTSGFYEQFFRGSLWSYSLQEHVDWDVLKHYVSHKFFIYDKIRLIKPTMFSFHDVEDVLRRGGNTVFVMSATDQIPYQVFKMSKQARAKTINEESGEIEALHFDANSIKLRSHFKDAKFLVYNDSAFPLWRVFVNGKRAALGQANIAFKGVWVPEGDNTIQFIYRSRGFYLSKFLLMIIFASVMIWLVYALWRSRNLEMAECQ